MSLSDKIWNDINYNPGDNYLFAEDVKQAVQKLKDNALINNPIDAYWIKRIDEIFGEKLSGSVGK